MQLRDYQQELVNKAIASIHDGKNPIIQLHTGGGKTLCIAEVVDRLVSEGYFVYILSHKKELQKQIKATIAARLPKEMIQHFRIFNPQARIEIKEDGKIVFVIDECHHSPAGTWYEYIKHHPRIGFTATPTRTENTVGTIMLHDIFDEIHHGPGKGYMIANGYWPEPIIYNGVDLQVQREIFSEHEYSSTELKAICTPESSEVVVRRFIEVRQKEGLEYMKTVCFSCPLNHANLLLKAFENYGIKAAVLTGKARKSDREAVLRQFANKEFEVLINIVLFTEGLDIPDLQCVLIARPTQSLILYEQMVGRGMRVCEGKNKVIIIDLTENFTNHWGGDGMCEIKYLLRAKETTASIKGESIGEVKVLAPKPKAEGETFQEGHTKAGKTNKRRVVNAAMLFTSNCLETILDCCNASGVKEKQLVLMKAIKLLGEKYGNEHWETQSEVLRELLTRMYSENSRINHERLVYLTKLHGHKGYCNMLYTNHIKYRMEKGLKMYDFMLPKVAEIEAQKNAAILRDKEIKAAGGITRQEIQKIINGIGRK